MYFNAHFLAQRVAYSRGARFRCRQLKDTRVMAVCLCHVETIDFSSQILSLYMVKEGDTRKTYPVINVPVHGEHDGTSYNSV